MLEQDFKRFIAKTRIQPNGCVLWTGADNGNGYGTFRYQGALCLAHRVAFEHWVGPIPDGLTVDHVKKRGCTSTLCVAAAHLEPVTQRENVARGDSSQATSLRNRPDQTKCAAGLHDWIENNIYNNPSGKRQCLACIRTRER